MNRKIKRIALFVMAAVTMLCFAACNRENGDENETPGNNDNQEVLAQTRWGWDGFDGFYVSSEIVFPGNNAAKVTFYKEDYSPVVMEGTYTYADGAGTMALKYQTTHQPINPTFTVSGNKLTLKIFGKTYEFNKLQ